MVGVSLHITQAKDMSPCKFTDANRGIPSRTNLPAAHQYGLDLDALPPHLCHQHLAQLPAAQHPVQPTGLSIVKTCNVAVQILRAPAGI